MTPEERTAIIEREWTVDEALTALRDLDELEKRGVWDRPAWASELAAAACGCGGFSLVTVTHLGYRKAARALMCEVEARRLAERKATP